jgi:hypothetical protein
MARITLSVLSLLLSFAQATGGLKGGSRELSSLTSRVLETAWLDDDGNYTYRFEVDSNTRSSSGYNTNSSSSINITHIQEMVTNQVQNYKAAAESKVWEFYQSSPSEWTESQWDFVLILFGGLLLLSCCCLSACCAYCCIYRGQDDDALSAKQEDRYIKRMWYNRLRRHRERYRKEREEVSTDADTIESQPTFDSNASTISSVMSSFEMVKNDKKESLLKKCGRSKSSRSTKTRKTQGTYESPSPGSLLSTFEVDKSETPKKSNGRSRDRVEC